MRNRMIGMSILGLVLFLFMTSGKGFSSEPFPNNLEAQSLQKADGEQTIEPGQEGGAGDPGHTLPGIVPPVHDQEMVIHPETPIDPEAVVTPPVVDPEMAVDPATRQPMTKDKLEQLTPQGMEKNVPDQK
ncbi:MAG: hypothetical protein H0W49_09250 [Nitrospirales bacterium]|nr:hypothetical protein [Nitrospirales bacterium]